MLQIGNNKAEKIPLEVDDTGTVRVTGSRVTLDSLVELFDQGATAEQITHSFPGLGLDDVYAVVTYYLRNKEEVRTYLATQDHEAAVIQQRLETEFPDNGFRERLLRLKDDRVQGKE